MPGDLQDPDASPWVGHYDPRFNDQYNTNVKGPLGFDQIIQPIARAILGHPLNKDAMGDVLGYLKAENLDYSTPGAQEVQEAVTKYIQIMNKKRKVASKWLTLIDF